METINSKEKELIYKKIKETESSVDSPTYIKQLKKNALAAFEKLDIPTTKYEEWKYTPLHSIFKNDYSSSTENKIDENIISSFFIKNIEANQIVVINGILNKELSHILTSPNELYIESFEKAYQEKSSLIEKHLGKLVNYEENIFTAANTAYLKDGILIHIPTQKKVTKPTIIHFINDCQHHSIFTQPRLLYVLGKNSEAEMIEMHHSVGKQTGFTNKVSEITLEENAHLYHYKIQDDHDTNSYIETTEIAQDKNSICTSYVITLNGTIIRNNLHVRLKEEYAQTNMYGLYILKNKMHVDNHTVVDHIKPNCLSDEFYKGIIDDQGKGVFNGKIYVRPHAQKTNAFQSNKTILVSPEASMDSKPQLEIWANDVKCSHGSTTGQLDSEAIFYLRSRGISEKEAKKLLIQAFAKEIIDKIRLDKLKIYLEELIIERMQG